MLQRYPQNVKIRLHRHANELPMLEMTYKNVIFAIRNPYIMTTGVIISAVLTLVAGIGIFLIACQMMSSNLESASSTKLKALFSKASRSRLLGVGIGTAGTAAIQSSGATTVMVIGFVNAGIMSLTQAATIIYGANIGTTITAQIVALGMFSGASAISTTVLFSAFAGVGAFLALFAKKDISKKIGGTLAGFGMLFVGLSMMSGSMSDFARLEGVKVFLSGIRNPILLVLIGTIFTAIIQSSSVMTSVAIAMLCTGLLSLDQGIFITMGSNIGSCVVAIIAGMTSGTNAKRTSLIHLFFNVSGVVMFLLVGLLLKLVTGGTSFGSIFQSMFPDAPQEQLAMFHTIFNVVTVILILPLTDALVKLVCRIIPDNAQTEDRHMSKFYFIDKNMLKTPPIAVLQTKNEIVNMAALAMRNFYLSLDMVSTLDLSRLEEFKRTENELDWLNNQIVAFVVDLSGRRGLGEKDHIYLSGSYRTVRDIERIGDYAENITEYAQYLKDMDSSFSEMALVEIRELRNLLGELYEYALKAYNDEDINALGKANIVEEEIDNFTKKMEDNHVSRLSAGACSPAVGAQYLSLSSNAERIGDHLINVAKTIRALKP